MSGNICWTCDPIPEQFYQLYGVAMENALKDCVLRISFGSVFDVARRQPAETLMLAHRDIAKGEIIAADVARSIHTVWTSFTLPGEEDF